MTEGETKKEREEGGGENVQSELEMEGKRREEGEKTEAGERKRREGDREGKRGQGGERERENRRRTEKPKGNTEG